MHKGAVVRWVLWVLVRRWIGEGGCSHKGWWYGGTVARWHGGTVVRWYGDAWVGGGTGGIRGGGAGGRYGAHRDTLPVCRVRGRDDAVGTRGLNHRARATTVRAWWWWVMVVVVVRWQSW